MEFKFIDTQIDKKSFLNTGSYSINPLLAENNLDNFVSMAEFFNSQNFMLLVDGHIGVGKSAVVDYFLNFLASNTVVLKYCCYEKRK